MKPLTQHLRALAWDLLSHAFPPATARSSLRPTVLSHKFLSQDRRCYKCAELPLMGQRCFIPETAQHALTGHCRCSLQKMCKFSDFPLLLLLFKRGPWGSSKWFLLNTPCPNCWLREGCRHATGAAKSTKIRCISFLCCSRYRELSSQ